MIPSYMTISSSKRQPAEKFYVAGMPGMDCYRSDTNHISILIGIQNLAKAKQSSAYKMHPYRSAYKKYSYL